MDVVLVPTTHWDREWYRTFQAFRARLVDTVDRVLDLLDTDPGYRFLLDGQTVVVEDYLEVRPLERQRLEAAIGEGRVAIGPWYVQPDSLLPSGEAHVRNLLEGRRAESRYGPVSRVGYTPDSFGHPARFPQVFAGFGIPTFVYWRGNGNEIDELPAEYRWEAPDGSAVVACHLAKGYFNAAGLPDDLDEAVDRLAKAVEDLTARTRTDRVLLLAGTDHQLPEARTAEICERLAERTGLPVRRGLLEDFTDGLSPFDDRPAFRGELLGGRVANLLPGVWSTRSYLKLRNRACEAALEGWAEPWAAIGALLGGPDERPSLEAAWRELLRNQAHDSICGCSQDAVHEQMLARYDAASELARETTRRALERVAGLGPERETPWTDQWTLAVFNPSPHPRTDVVRFVLDAYPPWTFGSETEARFHPMLWANLEAKGFEVDGRPARTVLGTGNDRVRLLPHQRDLEVEFVAADVPAFGWRAFTLRQRDEVAEEADEGTEIAAGGVAVSAGPDGTLTVRFGDRTFGGLAALEDVGDRGDTYDHDPVPGDVEVSEPVVRRLRHPSGLEHLEVIRTLLVPSLSPDRASRVPPTREVTVAVTARVAPGVNRVDLGVRVDNRAPDHRLRLLFPTGTPCERFRAATTFDVAERTPGLPDDSGWRHPAQPTFPHQGWVEANGLAVVAPGLAEGEVTPDGVIAVTLLRAVGWLSRHDLATRPTPAGPALETPGAQCIRTTEARLALLPAPDPRAARDAELGLWAVTAGEEPLWPAGSPMLELAPPALVLSALKPSAEGIVLRVLNPTDHEHEAVVRLGFRPAGARSVRLDETADGGHLRMEGSELRFTVPARGLRSVELGYQSA